MRTWHYSINAYHKTAHISLWEGCWVWFAVDRLSMLLCDALLWLPGGAWFHLHIHDPIWQCCLRRYTQKSVELAYEKVKELFGDDDPEFFREEEKLAAEMNAEKEG